MLIIPISRSPDWRRPPVVTLLLILVNCLIFFGLQSGDSEREAKALAYYASSSLAGIELPRYVAHLESRDDERADIARKALATDGWPVVLALMERDHPYMQRLRANEVIVPDDPDYASWLAQRQRYEKLAGSSMVDRYGFVPAESTFAGALGHMFLHGSFDHLLGNMAILFIVGYMVEEALGKRRFIAFYLIAGLGGVVLDWLVNGERVIPGIGASGAISGVMAMFVVIYGLRKIRFFYWVVVYFDFFRAPAIAVLPFWIANEVYQYLFNHGSNINYMAHLGGFIAGTALIAAQRAWGLAGIVVPQQEAAVDPLPAALARIDKLLGDLRIDEATRALRQLAESRPDDVALLVRYYRLARTTPGGDDYHRAAALIFALPGERGALADLLHDTFVEYLELAKPSVRFSSAQLAMLIRKLARAGHAEDADRLTRVLHRRTPDHPELPDLLLLVAECSRRAGNERRHQELLAQLHSDFPGSATAQNAARMYR